MAKKNSKKNTQGKNAVSEVGAGSLSGPPKLQPDIAQLFKDAAHSLFEFEGEVKGEPSVNNPQAQTDFMVAVAKGEEVVDSALAASVRAGGADSSEIIEFRSDSSQSQMEQGNELTDEPINHKDLGVDDLGDLDFLDLEEPSSNAKSEGLELHFLDEAELGKSLDAVEKSSGSEGQNSEAETAPAAEPLEFLGTELESFESVAIEETEFVDEERLESIIESILFASDRPCSLAALKQVFHGTNVDGKKIKFALDRLMVEYAGGKRGVDLMEVPGGYQLRTKMDNLTFIQKSMKQRPFKLSPPALETLAIVAYKQPVVKSEVDEIRGVESGHLLRALMEKNLVSFAGRSDLPGKPMQYQTTKRFLELFSLRSIKELPTLSQMDEILPEGIGADEDDEKKVKLSDVTESLKTQNQSTSYSDGEEELMKISSQLEGISTSTDFFEQEKQRQKMKKDEEKARSIQEALIMGEAVSNRDLNWLKAYEENLLKTEEKNNSLNSSEDQQGGALDLGHQTLMGADSKPEIDNATERDEYLEMQKAFLGLGGSEGADATGAKTNWVEASEQEEMGGAEPSLYDDEYFESNDLAEIDK